MGLDSLPHESLLTALGEVAAAFVGFSLVVGVLRARSEGSLKQTRRFGSMRAVAEIGLIAVGASFLPLVIHAFGASPGMTWRLASTALLIVAGSSLVSQMWRTRHGMPRKAFRADEPVRYFLVPALNVGSFGLLLSNLLVAGTTAGARYAAAVLLALAVAGVLFVSTTFSDPGERPPA